jgi:hypothetical protein
LLASFVVKFSVSMDSVLVFVAVLVLDSCFLGVSISANSDCGGVGFEIGGGSVLLGGIGRGCFVIVLLSGSIFGSTVWEE